MRVNKMVQARRKWAKFGDVAGFPPGPEMNITYTQPDPVELGKVQSSLWCNEVLCDLCRVYAARVKS